MDFAQAILDWVAANPENPLKEVLVWLADIIKFIAAL